MPEQLDQLIAAIADSYSRTALTIFLDSHFSKKLDQIASGTNDTEIVFSLLTIAEQEGWKPELLTELAKARPKKKNLQDAVKRALGDLSDTGDAGDRALLPGILDFWSGHRDGFTRAVVALLVIYAIVLTFVSTIPLSASLRLVRTNESVVPDPGYVLNYNSFGHAFNTTGYVVINVSPWVWLTGRLNVEVAKTRSIVCPKLRAQFDGWGATLKTIFIRGDSNEPGPGPSGCYVDEPQVTENLNANDRGLSFLGRAHAEPVVAAGLQLYIQGVTVPRGVEATQVKATLNFGKESRQLQTIGAGVENSILVKGGSAIVQNYQQYFELKRAPVPLTATIRLESPAGFFSSSNYTETFELKNVEPGSRFEVEGTQKGKIVLQLTYPNDIAFFERQDTLKTTQKLIPVLEKAGFVSRINSGAVNLPGVYNVLYAGKDVPTALIQKVFATIRNDIALKSVQTALELRSGINTQIQIGSSLKVRCLPPVDMAALAAVSEAEFRSRVAALAPPNCPD